MIEHAKGERKTEFRKEGDRVLYDGQWFKLGKITKRSAPRPSGGGRSDIKRLRLELELLELET